MMRWLPLIGFLLLLPTGTIAAPLLYHSRAMTHACIDIQALAWRFPEMRAQRRCFMVSPRQRWERIVQPVRGLLLMRAVPPHAGEPPLYFRGASLRRARDRRARLGNHHPSHLYGGLHRGILLTEAQVQESPVITAAAPLGRFIPAVAALATPTKPVVRAAPARRGRSDHLSLVLLLWALIIGAVTLLVRLGSRVRRPQTLHEPEASVQGPAGGIVPAGSGTCKSRCVSRLRDAGWDARPRFSAGLPSPDVVAHNNGVVLSLQCHASLLPVDVAAVEQACLVRDRQNSDVAAIVSDAPFTDAARELAERTGVVLLREEELASFTA